MTLQRPGLISSTPAEVTPTIVPNMTFNVDPRARAKANSTQAAVPLLATPNFGAREVTFLPRNQRFPIIGKTKDERWWQILVMGTPGWVSATSINWWNTQSVMVTHIADGGLPAAQEVYYLYALGQHRDELQSLSNITRYNRKFLEHTAWADTQKVIIPEEQLDPEFLYPAIGAIGVTERAIKSHDSVWMTGVVLLCLFYVIGLLAAGIIPGSIGVLLPTLSVGVPALIWIFDASCKRNFLHNDYRTKTQHNIANLQRLAVAGGAVLATAAAAGVTVAASQANKRGGKVDYGKLASGVAKAAVPLLKSATPLVAAAGSALVVNRVIEAHKEAETLEVEAKPILTHHTFISYRRIDSLNVADFLYTELSRPEAFANGAIFLDRTGIPPGTDFRAVLLERMVNCKVVVVLIGSKWLEELKIREQNTAEVDYVREEIAEALRRRLCVIPVLVKTDTYQTQMPKESDLPADIGLLAYRNAFILDVTSPDVTPIATQIREELSKHIQLGTAR